VPVTLRELRRIGALHIRRRETSKDEVIHKRKCEVLRYLWGYDGGDAQAASEVLQEPVVDSPMDQLLQAVQNWNALVRNRATPVVTFDLPGGEHLSFRVDYLNADMHETRIYVDPHRATAANITDIQRLRAGCPVNVDQRELADISPAHVIITPAHSIYDVGGNIISDPIWRTIALSITENHIDLRDSKAKEKLLEGGGFKVGGLEAYQVRCYHRSSLCLQACSTFVQAHYPAKKAVRLMVPNDECLLGLDDEARTSALTALIKAEARAARRRTGIDRIVCVYVGSIRGLTTAQVQLLIDSEIGTEPGIPVIATGLHVDELREELRYTFKGEVILCAPTNSHPLHQHGNGALDTRKKDLEAQEARNNPTALLCLNMRTNTIHT
jgi:hypothetical protein